MFDYAFDPSPDDRIELVTLLIRTTDDTARIYKGLNADAGTVIRVSTLRWVDQMLVTEQVRGSHHFESLNRTDLEWHYAYSRASRNEPDRRETRFDYDPGSDTWYLSDRPEGNQMLFSELVDNNHDLMVQASTPAPVWNGLEAKVTVGANIVLRDREVDTRRFKFQHKGPLSNDPVVRGLPAEEIFAPPYIGPDGFQLEETTRNTDNYTAEQRIDAYYLMLNLPVTEDLDLMTGVRSEHSLQQVSTFELFSKTSDPITAELDTTDYLPAATLTWRFHEDMQIRLAYSRTLSRPDFREMSPSTFEDVVGGRQVYGNPDLNRTLIDNFDVRWEWYSGATNNLSLGFFYKEFTDPIEVVIIPSTNPQLTFQNAPGATNMGVEVDFRQDLGFIHDGAAEFYLAGNFAWVDSTVDLGPDVGIATSKERPLQGQSPYVVNLMVGWDHPDTRSSVAALYNVFGERIVEVGAQGLPDVYEQPFQQVDLVYSQGLSEGLTLKFRLRNLLDDEVRLTQGDEEYETYRPGREYILTLSWNLPARK